MDYEIITRDTIPHYYGDAVRLLFFGTATLGFLSVPFLGDLVPFGTLFQVLAGIALIILAGLMNPRSKWVMVLGIIAAGFGACLLELSAISFHSRDSIQLLLAREVGAIMLITALYFSVKTLRAMSAGKVGQWPTPEEFEKPDTHKDQ